MRKKLLFVCMHGWTAGRQAELFDKFIEGTGLQKKVDIGTMAFAEPTAQGALAFDGKKILESDVVVTTYAPPKAAVAKIVGGKTKPKAIAFEAIAQGDWRRAVLEAIGEPRE